MVFLAGNLETQNLKEFARWHYIDYQTLQSKSMLGNIAPSSYLFWLVPNRSPEYDRFSDY